jgi:uncharacterized membrane protein
MSEPVSNPAEPPRVLYEAVLMPHRSLPPGGFMALMLVLAAVSFVSGVGFVRMGAWPVTGFFGLDILLLYVAFRLNYRSARQREIVRLAGDEFTVERIGIRGDRRFWTFQPYWLRVRLVEEDDESNRLLLTSHGRTLTVGGFLSPAERRELAHDLEEALDRYRTRPV